MWFVQRWGETTDTCRVQLRVIRTTLRWSHRQVLYTATCDLYKAQVKPQTGAMHSYVWFVQSSGEATDTCRVQLRVIRTTLRWSHRQVPCTAMCDLYNTEVKLQTGAVHSYVWFVQSSGEATDRCRVQLRVIRTTLRWSHRQVPGTATCDLYKAQVKPQTGAVYSYVWFVQSSGEATDSWNAQLHVILTKLRWSHKQMPCTATCDSYNAEVKP